MATLNPVWKAGKKKIALVLGGGGSLGAYEAGALIELMYALDLLNAGLPEGERFEVDVISGASAGGMSAAMTARIVMYDYPSGRQDLYRAWVQDIRMEDSAAGPGLLEDDKQQSNALLSKNIVRRIAQAYIGAPVRPGAAVKPASFAPETVRLRLTLTNLNGLDYDLPTRSVGPASSSFLTTRFSDGAEFKLGRAPEPGLWSADKAGIRDSSIACGNFPIGFQPQGLLRQNGDYHRGPLQGSQVPAYFPAAMTFIDGGMFDNEPLGKAISSAADSDVEADGQPDPNRLFLMIHPNVARSDHREGTGDAPGKGVAYSANPEFGLLAQAERLLNILLTENAVSDWVRANEVNAIVDWRDDFIGMLGTIVKQTTVTDTDALIADLDALILRIATVKAQATPGQTAAEYLAEVQSVDKLVTPDPAMGPKRTQIFEKILFILNHVADLQEKRRLWFEVIGHDADLPLAGAQVLGFAGFFQQDWRIYDYRRGRVDAYKALSGWSDAEKKCLVQHAILGVYDREPAEQQPSRGLETPAPDGNNDYLVTLPYWKTRTGVPNFPRVSWSDVPKDMQEALLDRVLDRLLQAFDASVIVKALVKSFGKAKLASLLSGS